MTSAQAELSLTQGVDETTTEETNLHKKHVDSSVVTTTGIK